MRGSFRTKLLLSYLLLLVVTSGAIYLYLNQSLQGSIVDSLRENLASQARMAALMASRELRDPRADAPRLAAEAGRSITARVTIVDPGGVVIGDSEVPPSRLAELENHRDRPEVQGARQGGFGSAIRYSATLRTDMLYVAVPFDSPALRGGIVRLALPLSAVNRALAGLHSTLGLSLLAAFILSLVFSFVLSRLTSRPLRQVAAIAVEFGRGNFRRRLPTGWHDELGELARIMNDMAGRLEEQLTSLANERNRLDAILAGMGEGLMVVDADGTVTLVNPAFRRLLAVDEKIVGRPLSTISRHPSLHKAFRAVRDGKREVQEEMVLEAGGEKTLMTSWVPLRRTTGITGVVAVFHDISDLKRLEKVRKDFVANVSHELRTPVTVIRGYAETLREGVLGDDPERAARFVEIIHNHAGRLTSLITDLLSLSELESSDFTLHLQPAPLEGTIRRVCTLLEGKAEAKQIVITPPSGGLPRVLADQGRLEQVLVNLVDNGVKYTPAGGRIAIGVVTEGELVRISVRDTGPGIPPESIPRLFERFYRVDAGRSRDEGGTGLGLAIVKHIVQLHGGTVRVENNTPPPGATFSFTLQKG
jgi:two-component system phosphate regulon sensor histidine kinase PhoR